MGIPIVAGRPFVAEDSTAGRPHVIISESAARRLFGTAPAAGKLIAFDESAAPPMEVVGVTRDVRFRSVEVAEAPAMYLLSGEDARAPRFTTILFARTSGVAGAAISAITRAVREDAVPMGVSDAQPLTDIVRASTSSTRFVATLLLGFAASAALLAGLGGTASSRTSSRSARASSASGSCSVPMNGISCAPWSDAGPRWSAAASPSACSSLPERRG